MAAGFVVKHDLNRLTRELSRQEIAVAQKMLPSVINRVATSTRSKSVKHLNSTTRLKQKDIRERIKLTKASTGRPNAILNATSGKASNLIKFVSPAHRNTHHFRRRNRRGAFKVAGVKAKAWGKQKTYRGTFIIQGDGNQTVVVKRGGSTGNKLESVLGPSIRNEFDGEQNLRVMRQTARERTGVELSRAINHFILRRRAS